MIQTRYRDSTAIGFSEPKFGLIRAARPAGRPKKVAPKEAVNIRLDPDVLEHFRAGGPGWQSRINEALRKAAGL